MPEREEPLSGDHPSDVGQFPEPRDRKADAEFLADHLEDMPYQIVAEYERLTDGEQAVLRPRTEPFAPVNNL